MSGKKHKVWAVGAVRPAKPKEAEKQEITGACEAFIRDVLKPRFLPEIKPTKWNYVVDIHGAWAAGRYRFIQRYRSGMAHNTGEEFDAPFARINRMGPDNFETPRLSLYNLYELKAFPDWLMIAATLCLVSA